MPPDSTAPAGVTAALRLQGLTEAEAARRLAQDGPNRMNEPRRRRLPQIVRDVLREPMLLLLLVAVGFYFLLGDTAEAVFLLFGAVTTISLVVVQEARSERALAALKALAEPTARVIRDGSEHRIAASDLVRGDLVLLGEGGRAPADGALVAGDVLSIDESVLTGESAPVVRTPLPSTEADDGADPPEHARISAGGLLVRGHGVARVTATGAATRLGQIGAALADAAEPLTPLQRTTRRLVGVLGLFALGLSAAVLVAYGLLRGDWIGGGLAALTLGIALIPEEFPMVLAVFLALGGGRMAKGQVLVRRTAAIEALGGISVLCVDKTGTLTRNQMGVAALWAADGGGEVSGSDGAGVAILQAAVLASAVHPVDPMDRALHAASACSRSDPPLRSYPLRPDRLAFIQAWAGPAGDVLYAAKGAPEAVFDLCRLDPVDRAAAEAAVTAFARQGLRVLGVARAERPSDDGGDPGGEVFRFDGLVAFEDPVREDVPPALAAAAMAGVRVVMITGDFPETALAIARDAGLDVSGGVLTGARLQTLADSELREAVAEVRVFARVAPDQKLRLVRALQANGERVGMFGDGVNDAPALEAADVGVAMGGRGVDVAREASDLILLDDRFASVVSGIAEGRRIFANLKAALAYLVVVHIPMAGLALLPPLLGVPPVLFPMQVVLLELVIDPMCALVFEGRSAAPDAMRRPPRTAAASLLTPARLTGAIAQGLVLLAGGFGLYLALLRSGQDASAARAAAFVFVVAANLGAAAVLAGAGPRGEAHQRMAFAAIAGLAAAGVTAALAVPPLAGLFGFNQPSLAISGTSAGLGMAAGLAVAAAGRLRLRTAT
ncbi:MAG: HAD family hydrolase [Phenylobacterium sp.]|uniref:cation-translocating P-type ATPase n=1 Tax=Phenylobacterium sp. TaxID=1871053 RepID=UPI0012160ABE|nr:HAD-IC family P-type ATPase [Phenylobacterium sp.]TAJ69821.1 MAG: HAD family hydrolase [Phenylobacterium sp.]